MAKIKKKFDIKDREMMTFDVIPVGLYTLEIVKSSEAPNSKKTGHVTKIEISVCKGEYKGRKIWVNLNLDNESDDARRISEDELASMHKAIGIKKLVSDTEKLHNKPFKAEVGIDPNPGYSPKNVIKKYIIKGEGGSGDDTMPWDEEEKKEKGEKKKDKKKKDKKKSKKK